MKKTTFVFILSVLCYIGGVYNGKNFKSSTEYQFEVIDDSVYIKDYDTLVGVIALEGDFKNLIDSYNK